MIGEKNFEWLNKIFRKQKFIIDGILAILILLPITDFLFGIFSGNNFGLLRWITGLKPPWNSIMMAESILLLRIVLLKRRILITSRWVSRFYALTVFLISFGLLLLPVAGFAFWIIDLPYLGNETWGIIENLWILIK